MAYGIIDFDGTVTPPDSTYPYGQIKDIPGGTVVNTKSNGDMQQFFQRIAATGGITLNSLPDNADNGFQLAQALGVLVSKGFDAFAETVNAVYGANVAVLVSGMGVTSAGPTTTIADGYFYYNGKLVHFNSFIYGAIPGGDAVIIQVNLDLTSTDGFAQGSGLLAPPVTDATKFVFDDMLPFPNQMIAPYTNVTPGTGWSSAGSGVTPKYTTNGNKQAWLTGIMKNTSGGPLVGATMFTLPFAPTQEIYIHVTDTVGIAIRTTGKVDAVGTILNNGEVSLGGITYLVM